MMMCELILAAALLLPGQETKPSEATFTGTLKLSSGGTVTLNVGHDGGRPIDEQIEVMRALLVRKLGDQTAPAGQPRAAFGNGSMIHNPASASLISADAMGSFSGGDPSAPSYRNIATAIEPDVEGNYLDGYGVVFAVTLPPTGQDPRPGAAQPKASPEGSDWDRAQKALRGEPAPQKTGMPKRSSVGDIMLKLLADNGKHFTALKEDERLTIAITFRGQTHHAMTITTSAPAPSANMMHPGRPHPPVYGVGTLVVPAEAGATASGLDEVLLGELHLRQGQTDQAIEAFKKAEGRADPQSLADIYPKLAQAYLAANKLDEARVYLDKAKALREKPAEAANPIRPPAAATAKLPARLTISATKKLLDQIGNGQISLDEFRKQATIEYIPAAP